MRTKFRNHSEPTGKTWWEKIDINWFDVAIVVFVIGVVMLLGWSYHTTYGN